MSIAEIPKTPTKRNTIISQEQVFQNTHLVREDFQQTLEQLDLEDLRALEEILTVIDIRLRLADPGVQKTLDRAQAILTRMANYARNHTDVI